MYKLSKRKRENIRRGHISYLDKIGNHIGATYYKKTQGTIIRVKASDYPLLRDNYSKFRNCKDIRFKWVLLSHKVWVDNGNRTPNKEEVIFHLDGDNRNDNIDNLKLISRGTLCLLNRKRRVTKNKRINVSNLLLTDLECKIRRKKCK